MEQGKDEGREEEREEQAVTAWNESSEAHTTAVEDQTEQWRSPIGRVRCRGWKKMSRREKELGRGG